MPSVRSAMSIGILLMLILSSLSMVLSASKADAQTACDAQFTTLSQAIDAADFTNDKDRQSLLAKVEAAKSKLGAGKSVDAEQKILDTQTAVNRLAADGKLADAGDINAAIDAALTCIRGTSSA